MKNLFDTLEVWACLVLLLLSEGWQVVRRLVRHVAVGVERLALVALYLFAEIADTVSGLFAVDADSDSLPGTAAPAPAGAVQFLPVGAAPAVSVCALVPGPGPSGGVSGPRALPGAAGAGGRGQGLPGACSPDGGAARGLRGRSRDRDGKDRENVAIRIMRRFPLASFRGLMNIPIR